MAKVQKGPHKSFKIREKMVHKGNILEQEGGRVEDKYQVQPDSMRREKERGERKSYQT